MKQCGYCIYGAAINLGPTESNGHAWACGHLIYTGARRPCPPPGDGKCGAFIAKQSVRRPKLALKGSHT